MLRAVVKTAAGDSEEALRHFPGKAGVFAGPGSPGVAGGKMQQYLDDSAADRFDTHL